MKRRLIGVAALVLLGSGCTPHIFGVPEEHWARMSETERQAAIDGYNERERIREERRVWEARRRAIEALLGGNRSSDDRSAPQVEWMPRPEAQAPAPTTIKQPAPTWAAVPEQPPAQAPAAPATRLRVKLSAGKGGRDGWKFSPVNTWLTPGQRHTVTLREAGRGRRTQEVVLHWQGDRLLVGGQRLTRQGDWGRGHEYRVAVSGIADLRVEVKEQGGRD